MNPDNSYNKHKARMIVESAIVALYSIHSPLREAEKQDVLTPQDIIGVALLRQIEELTHDAQIVRVQLGHCNLFPQKAYTSSVRRMIYGACLVCFGAIVGLTLGMALR